MQRAKSAYHAIRLALIAGTALVAPAAYAQDSSPPPAAPAPAEDASPPAIVVTGFRQSLQAALNLKKNSVSAVDAIVSEDIAKFPDQNLAESLQRISGVAITRDGGEGRQITVRGLGSQFTVTRVNGLPAQSTSMLAGSGGSPNRDRSFDFNVFASELFKSLIVHKTAEANLDEGSLGAVVDLNTGHPLGAKSGLTGLVSASGSYNSLSGNVGPRLAGLLNWKNEDGTLGINASVAYSKIYTLELGNNTTRWAQAPFASVTTGGVTTQCFRAAPISSRTSATRRRCPSIRVFRVTASSPMTAAVWASPDRSSGSPTMRPIWRSTASSRVITRSVRNIGPKCCSAAMKRGSA
jgi:TonB-dependent receptor